MPSLEDRFKQLAESASAHVRAKGYTLSPMIVRERAIQNFYARADAMLNMSQRQLEREIINNPEAPTGDVLLAVVITRGMQGSSKHTQLLWERMMGAVLRIEHTGADGKDLQRPYQALPSETLIEFMRLIREAKQTKMSLRQMLGAPVTSTAEITVKKSSFLSVPADLSHFYVITIISNPVRYKRRYELYHKFASLCACAGVALVTVEIATGHRNFMVTDRNNPNHVQIRSVEELWHKENLINLGIERAVHLDPDCREVAWVDADCMPMVPPREWFEETWHALQHYEFVQMWEYMLDYGPGGEPITKPQPSFMKTYVASGYEVQKAKSGIKHTLAGHSGMITLGRPGLAWAANLSAFNAVGRLIDACILGSGDWHMAHGLVGAMDQKSWEFGLASYADYLLQWQEKAERWIKRDVGYVPVSVGHWFHGKKVNRQYGTRGGILVRNKYNPRTDVKYDAQGLLQLETYEPRQLRLRDEIRSYFRNRNEDSIDL